MLDSGIARAGAAVAARRRDLGISQRELARQGVITASSMIAFEKGRSWPRERTRHTLEELLHWPAGTIARIKSGALPVQTVYQPAVGDDDASLVVDMVAVALTRFDTAIADLPAPETADYAGQVAELLAELRKLESITARAVRHSQGSTTVMKALGSVRRRYDDLMVAASAYPNATLGQRLYAARRRASVTAAEAGGALGTAPGLIESVEAGEPADGATTRRIETLIADLGG